mmetsp:Transcript_12383/g.18256  ORF Transcript_12383/g.18256 Transcript_12383/m.18256 type:complete len:86 (+) Transcript_12383:834-1091(+)
MPKNNTKDINSNSNNSKIEHFGWLAILNENYWAPCATFVFLEKGPKKVSSGETIFCFMATAIVLGMLTTSKVTFIVILAEGSKHG